MVEHEAHRIRAVVVPVSAEFVCVCVFMKLVVVPVGIVRLL